MQKGNSGFSTCTEISAKAKMNACKKTIKDITADILTAKQNDSGIFTKQTNDWFCPKQYCNTKNRAKQNTYANGIP